MIKIFAVVAAVSASLGFIGGSIATYKIYKVSALNKELRYIKADRARYRESLGFSRGLEKDDASVEISNEEIVNAILAKAPKPQPRECPKALPELKPSRDMFACAHVDSLRELGRLR